MVAYVAGQVCRACGSAPFLIQRGGHLDEYNVPDLKHIGVVHIDKMRRITAADSVVVDLTAGPTRPLVPHLPEVVRAPKRQYPGFWQQLQPAAAMEHVPGVYKGPGSEHED